MILPVRGVVHCKRSPYDVLIDRTSKWGNHYRIGRDGSRDEVIDKYERWIRKQDRLIQDLPELSDKILACLVHAGKLPRPGSR